MAQSKLFLGSYVKIINRLSMPSNQKSNSNNLKFPNDNNKNNNCPLDFATLLGKTVPMSCLSETHK